MRYIDEDCELSILRNNWTPMLFGYSREQDAERVSDCEYMSQEKVESTVFINRADSEDRRNVYLLTELLVNIFHNQRVRIF